MPRYHKISLQNLYFKYIQAIFPSRCLLCGTRLLFQNEKGIEICNKCYNNLEPLKGRRCKICSTPLVSEYMICIRCRDKSYHFKRHFSLFQYRGAIKELIYFYKFKHKHSLAFLFSSLLHNTISTMFPHYPVVPVPARKHFLKKQRWDHLAFVANILKKNYKTKIFDCLLRKGDIPQKKLSFNERKQNLRGKIAVKKGICEKYTDAVLFDDIFTTGATADECSRVLLNYGVQNVYVISIAID